MAALVNGYYDKTDGLMFDGTAATADEAAQIWLAIAREADPDIDQVPPALVLGSLEVGSVYKTKADALRDWSKEIDACDGSVAQVWGGWKVTLSNWTAAF